MTPRIFIFDMDHTLVDNDCDVSWKSYAVKAGLAPPEALDEAARYFDDYNAGTLNINEFLLFQFREFIGRTPAEMAVQARRHFEEFVLPQCYPKAKALVAELLAAGQPLAILSSTNDIIARPVADYFGIADFIGTQLEVKAGRFTGEIVGEYAVGPGKLAPASRFAAAHGATLAEVEYYGDSINDRYILEAVGFPVAVNPSPELEVLARERGWKILGF